MKNKLSTFIIVSTVLIGGISLFSMPVAAPDPPDLPDLTISQENITFSRTTLPAGIPVTIDATVWNVGNADAGDVEVNFYEEDTLIGSKNVDVPVNGTWEKSIIDTTGDVGRYSSIAVDSAEGIHISYSDFTDNFLKYAYKPSVGSWDIDILASMNTSGGESSIAIDSLDGVHVCYSDPDYYDLLYTYKPSGGLWPASTYVDTDDVAGGSIAIDSSDGVHILYSDVTNIDIKYAYKPSGGSWSTSTIDSVGDLIGGSIAVDSAGGVHISYHNTTVPSSTTLKYAYKPSGGSWEFHTIDTVGENTDLATSIAIDSANGVHISYHEATNNDLKYAYKPSGGSCTTYYVDSPGSVGYWNSIAVDSLDGVHISYRDSSNKNLKYAYKPSGGSWTIYYVESPGDVGMETSITVDNSDRVHISYLDWQEMDLKYAYLIAPLENVQTSISWIPSIAGLRNITIKIDENNVIEELNETNNNATVSVTVIPGYNGTIVIEPESAILELNETQQFNATGMDYYGNEEPISVIWYVNGGGTINQSGFFTALYPGSWTVQAVDENQPDYTGQADVTVQVNMTADTDLDGILDWWEVSYGFDPFNASDANLDTDLDNLNNLQEFLNNTEPKNWDTDSDSLPDGWEVNNSLDPINDSDATLDSDKDNLNNLGEYKNGGDPHNPDSDNDSLPDGWEVSNKLNLTNSSDVMNDPDIDGLTNLQEFFNYSNPQKNDTDGDNLGDGFEVIFSKTNASLWDTNGNGVGDGLEFILSKGYLGWIESLPDDWIGMTITWDNYTILIKTNSSVLEGEFDKDEQKLKIKVSGPDGTVGVTEMDIPKSLCEPEDIEIELDGELLNYTLTEDDTYYYIHIEYNHSIHDLVADFSRGVEEPIEPSVKDKDYPAYLIALTIIAVIVILIFIAALKNRSEKGKFETQELPPEKLSMMLEKKHSEGKMTDETYEDIKSLLEKYRGG